MVLEEGACVPALRPSWARRGRWAVALAWLDAALESLGTTRTGIEQRKTWQISSLSRVETSLGHLYFKAVPPFFAREPALMRWLMEHFPAHSPEVLAHDTDRGWMLMRDFGGQELGRDVPLEVAQKALGDYARLQVETIPHAARLRALGCLDRSLEVLKRHIHQLL